jgi:hypothetical protein
MIVGGSVYKENNTGARVGSLLFSPLLPISALHHHLQGRIQRWGERGSSPSTAAAIIEPLLKLLLIFIGMKEMEEDVRG